MTGFATNELLDPHAVANVQHAVRVSLEHESGIQSHGIDLNNVDERALLSAVMRHRVAPLLADHADVLGLPPRVHETLQIEGTRQRFAALRVAQVTMDLAAHFQREGIRVLAIKGVGLSVLTTNDFAARGDGDIDLWVHPDDLAGAGALLHSLGYIRTTNALPPSGSGVLWRLHRWIYYEEGWKGPVGAVDLHWALSPSRSALPDFDTAWSRRSTLDIGGEQLPVLSPRDAFDHSCAHAMKDGWMWLRSLVDVFRLMRRSDLIDYPRESAASRPATALTVAITRDVIGVPHGVAVPDITRRKLDAARAVAADSQLLVSKGPPKGPPIAPLRPLKPRIRKHLFDRMAYTSPVDDVRTLARISVNISRRLLAAGGAASYPQGFGAGPECKN
jgi:hypothetical protein